MKRLRWGTITEALTRIDWATSYLVIALTAGVLFVFITPPLTSWDERPHYYRSWSVSEGQLRVPSSGIVRLPENAADLANTFPNAHLTPDTAKIDVGRVLDELDTPFGAHQADSASISSRYGPLGYVPQATAILLLRPFGRSPLAALYLGKLLNLFCSVALVYFAIRVLPFAKPALFLIALLPMVLQETASLSPDALLLSGSFFFSALVLHCTQLERLSAWQMVALPIAAVVLLNTKPGYAELALLVLLLTPRQFGGLKRYFAVVGSTVVLAGLLAVALQMIAPADSQEILERFLGPDNGVDAHAQLSFVLHHPFAFPFAVARTFDASGLILAKSGVASFAWGQTTTTDLVVLLAALAAAAVIATHERVRLAAWRRAIVLGMAALVGLVVCLAFYVSFTPVGAATIQGVQGRYFIPSVTLAFFGLVGFPYGRRWLMPLTVIVLVVLLLLMSALKSFTLYYS